MTKGKPAYNPPAVAGIMGHGHGNITTFSRHQRPGNSGSDSDMRNVPPQEVMLFVIDDDSTTRTIVSEILGPKCRAFESAEAFLASDPPPSGVLVLDYLMEGMTGLDLQEQLGSRYHIVFLSGESDIPIAAQAFRERCVDFLTKPVSPGHLVQAVGEAIRAHKRVERAHSKIDTLTPRELEVAHLVAQGFNNHHVGAALGTSHKTVESQKRDVFRKTGAASVVELAELLRVAG